MLNVIRLLIARQGQEACIQLTELIKQSLGVITIRSIKLGLTCQRKTLRYTRSFTTKTIFKRCAFAGSCTGEKCAEVKPETKLLEF